MSNNHGSIIINATLEDSHVDMLEGTGAISL
jgi:hypothetical protein